MDENLRKLADAIGSPVRRGDIYLCTLLIVAAVATAGYAIHAKVREISIDTDLIYMKIPRN